MRPQSRMLAPLLAAATIFAVPPGTASQQRSVTVEPSQVDVTIFYQGRTIHVTGPVPSGAEVAIAVVGQEGSLALKRKGKVLGLIWMNVGDVTFESVPDFYQVRSTCALEDLAAPEVLDGLGLGFAALEARAAGASRADDSLFGELVRLKVRDGLWGVAPELVSIRPSEEGEGVLASADFFLPPKAPPGEYRVVVYAFAAGVAELVGEARVQVAQAGVAAFISTLASRHGLLYGVLSVLIAGAAGLLTGVVFGHGSRKAH